MHKFFNPRRDFANVTKTQQARAQANQQAWKEIPLRDFIRDIAAMQALDPLLKMRFEIESTHDYIEIKEIISEVLYSDMGPGEQTEKQLASIMKHIAKHLEENTVSTSGENYIPGFRQIVFLNLDNAEYFDMYSRTIRMAAVTDDGRLVTNILKGTENAEKLQSTAEMLEVALVGKDEWGVMSPREDRNPFRLFDLDLDKNSETTIEKLNIGYNNIPFELERCRISRKKTSDRFDIHNKIIKILTENVNHNLDLARMTLCNALDPNVLHNIRAGHITRLSQVMWLTGGDGADPTQIQARQQAVKAYPILAINFTESGDDFYRKTIDARESLSNAIATRYHVAQSKVKNIQGLSRQGTGCKGEYYSYITVRQILSLSDRFIPLTRRQIQQLPVLEDFQFIIFKNTSNQVIDLETFMNRLSTEGNLWKMANRLEKYDPRNVKDAVNFLVTKLFIPAALNGIRKNNGKLPDFYNDHAYRKIVANFKIRELLDLSDRYHRNIHRWEDRLTSISFQQNWPGLLGTVELENGYVARELVSSIDLKAQGRAENHCVGGYMPTILKGNADSPTVLIFSIEKNGTILSTVEINCVESEDGLQAWVERNESYSNAIPSEYASVLAEHITLKATQVKPDAWHAYLDHLHSIRTEISQRSKNDRYTEACGFDPYDRNMLEQVWEELKSILPRAMRKSGLDAFIDWVGEELKQKPPQWMRNSGSNAFRKQEQSDQIPDELPCI